MSLESIVAQSNSSKTTSNRDGQSTRRLRCAEVDRVQTTIGGALGAVAVVPSVVRRLDPPLTLRTYDASRVLGDGSSLQSGGSAKVRSSPRGGNRYPTVRPKWAEVKPKKRVSRWAGG